MTWGHAALALIVALVGFLAYRGTGRIRRSVAAAFIVPGVGVVLIAILVPVAWREHLTVGLFLVLLIAAIAFLVSRGR